MEAHKLKGLVRFIQVGDNLFYSSIHPENNVIENVGNHFIRRFPTQYFIIHDKNRNIAMLYNQKEYTIDDILQAKGITKKIANQKIKEEIKDAQQKSESLQKITGASTYTRDYTSDIYSISNATEYFMGADNALYIIFAYGNDNHTSEMDIVVM